MVDYIHCAQGKTLAEQGHSKPNDEGIQPNPIARDFSTPTSGRWA
jgi:hypothetical protein